MIESPSQLPVISPKNGFVPLQHGGLNSSVLVKDGEVYKLTTRNTMERLRSDYKTLLEEMEGFEDHIPYSEIFEARFNGATHACVKQKQIVGEDFKKLGKDKVLNILRENKHGNHDFIKALLGYMIRATDNGQLHPDIVGYPNAPDLFHAINLIVETSTGRIMLCDIGLAPHESTIVENSTTTNQAANTTVYLQNMREAMQIIESLDRS